MPSKGRSLKNMAQHGSKDGGGRHPQSQGLADVDGEHGSTEPSQENVNLGGTKRAKWSHQAKLCLIELLKDHDVPGFRTNNAWSKEAWNNIVSRLNAKLGTSYTLYQAKQKEQDLKKDFRAVKDLLDQSGFGWDNERNMVHAPESVWASFAARKDNEAALSWRTKSFPYYNDLFKLYDGRYAEGRTRHGMDHYASKSKNASVPSAQTASVPDTPSPTLNGLDEPALQFSFDEEVEEGNLEFSQRSAGTHVHQMEVPPNSTQRPLEVLESRRGKKQKGKSASPDDGFHERYLKLKKEEIDRFAAIEERKLEDPYSINKCITVLEDMNSLQLGDLLMASDIFESKDKREFFLSFKSDALRLAWVTKEIDRRRAEHQN